MEFLISRTENIGGARWVRRTVTGRLAGIVDLSYARTVSEAARALLKRAAAAKPKSSDAESIFRGGILERVAMQKVP